MQGEYDENVIRKDFTPSEEVRIWNSIESLQGKKDLCPMLDTSEKRRDKAAKLLDIGKSTLLKAKQVVEYGDNEIIEKMDRTGNVDRAYQEVNKFNIKIWKKKKT